MVDYETFSTEARFSKIFLDLLTTPFPNTSPSAARAQIAPLPGAGLKKEPSLQP